MYLTSNIVDRVFNIRAANGAPCTAFALDHGERQFLVTAGHAFDGSPSNVVFVRRGENWEEKPCKIASGPYGKLDIAVVDFGYRFLKPANAVFSGGGVFLGEEVRVVGYPLGFLMADPGSKNGFPVPFVASGCVGGITDPASEGAVRRLYLSALLDPGYSGAPVVIPSRDNPNKPQVIGVVEAAVRYHESRTVTAGEKTTIERHAAITEAAVIEDVIALAATML